MADQHGIARLDRAATQHAADYLRATLEDAAAGRLGLGDNSEHGVLYEVLARLGAVAPAWPEQAPPPLPVGDVVHHEPPVGSVVRDDDTQDCWERTAAGWTWTDPLDPTITEVSSWADLRVTGGTLLLVRWGADPERSIP